MDRHCTNNYGFITNHDNTAKLNSIRIIGNKNKKKCFNKCNNMAFNDLTTHDKPKMNIRTSLGLGPKFCAQPKGTQWRDTSRMIKRFKRYVILKNYIMSNSFVTDEEIPRLRRKNEKW